MLDLVDVGVLLLVVLTLFVAAFFVFLVWRKGYMKGWREARGAPPACPACGYELTGLKACRCPECGREFTLEQLWHMPQSPSRRGEDDAL
ncbi:MAG: hypothetical protein KJ057_11905 [Phycisphaerae bacterium]|nr:MAG: hypothetical protein EDS66_05405 [Planctomycetota bacterium]KAB2937303.1 MAG: hypothetical protein F9K17_16255 [Phycisphaerae bacterium]MBE7457225.1 hypothetical protein [Planctomycetia bacterium]MCK6465441.1 hypothetical protein [Phycisphaerae bacterium]MCL4719166.1 hypothetical protein [Phycisphaerae bacterium]